MVPLTHTSLQLCKQDLLNNHQCSQHLQLSSYRPDAELRKTLSVALNKLGDLQYLRQNLPAARGSYHEALAVRRSALRDAEAGSHEEAVLAGRHVDVAVSLAKVADIEKVGYFSVSEHRVGESGGTALWRAQAASSSVHQDDMVIAWLK